MTERQLIHQGGIPIGYFEGGTAVMDADFWAGETACSLARRGDKMRFQPGVAARLRAEEEKKPLPRKVRVHQVKPQAVPEKKFICYALLYQRFGGISPEDYQVVFDDQLDTDCMRCSTPRSSPKATPVTGCLSRMWWNCTMTAARNSGF